MPVIVEPDFPDHWKTRMLVGLLGDDEAAPVYVLRLWGHCQQRKQFRFENLPCEALKALCRFPGHANKLEASLATSGFIRRDEAGVIVVINWDQYNASLLAAWENGAKGGRPKRKPKNPRVTHGIPTGNPQVTHGVTDREEKSREDESRSDSKGVNPLKPPAGYAGDLPDSLNVGEFRLALADWLAYKAERKDVYQPTGFSQMLSRAASRVASHGLSSVVEAMRTAMANGWQGWDQQSLFSGGKNGNSGNRGGGKAPGDEARDRCR